MTRDSTLTPAHRFRVDEATLVRLMLGVVAVHVVDDSFLQPPPGTSAAGHLASGLVPLSVLVGVAVLCPRPHAGARATLEMTVGALSILVAVPVVYYLLAGSLRGDDYSGLAAVPAGIVLLLTGPVVLWRSRCTGGRHALRRTVTPFVAVIVALGVVWFVVFPVGVAYVYTHTGRTPTTPDVGLPVAVTTTDALDLSAWYVPSQNRPR